MEAKLRNKINKWLAGRPQINPRRKIYKWESQARTDNKTIELWEQFLEKCRDQDSAGKIWQLRKTEIDTYESILNSDEEFPEYEEIDTLRNIHRQVLRKEPFGKFTIHHVMVFAFENHLKWLKNLLDDPGMWNNIQYLYYYYWTPQQIINEAKKTASQLFNREIQEWKIYLERLPEKAKEKEINKNINEWIYKEIYTNHEREIEAVQLGKEKEILEREISATPKDGIHLKKKRIIFDLSIGYEYFIEKQYWENYSKPTGQVTGSPTPGEKQNENNPSKTEINMAHVALLYIYKGEYINNDNAQEIAAKYGWKSKYSGKKLIDRHNEWALRKDRTEGIETKSDFTKRYKLLNTFLENFKDHLTEDQQNQVQEEIETVLTYREELN